MSFLIAAVVLVGMLCTLDLILTFGVIRRLRVHTQRLAGLGDDGEGHRAALTAGESVGDFVSSTVDGELLSPESLDGDTLVGFFALGCQPCEEKKPEFLAYAKRLPGGRREVLAVVVGDPAAATETAAQLTQVARVVVERPDGPVSTAFRAYAYPTILMTARTGDGRLVVTAGQVDLTGPPALARLARR